MGQKNPVSGVLPTKGKKPGFYEDSPISTEIIREKPGFWGLNNAVPSISGNATMRLQIANCMQGEGMGQRNPVSAENLRLGTIPCIETRFLARRFGF